ncbi:MAG: phosphoribosylglycinamide formyltransferase [Vicinamibacterales bacterium]
MLTTGRPLRVAVLCSRRAPGLLHLLDAPSGHGAGYEVCCVVATEAGCADAAAVQDRGIPVVTHDITAFYTERSSKVYRDFMTRRAYDRATVEILAAHAPDLVLLDGYLYLLTRPMLDAYRHRMLNLHFSDLTIRRADRRPAYVGIRAVRDAIADGQTDTSATVHLVNDEPDGGAPIVRSWSYPVSPLAARARQWQALDMLKAYAYAHQEWMIRGVSGPLLSAALALVADARVDLDGLGSRDPATVTPWIVDEHGRLTPPAATRMHAILEGYKRASA